MKKFLAVFLVFSMLFVGSSVFALSFSDLPSTHWAYPYITELTNKKVINGYEDGTFRPSGTVTRGEFIKLAVVASLPEGMDISDAETSLNHWAGTYVWIATQYGVLTPGDITLANINEPITRIEMVRIIAKSDIIFKGNTFHSEKQITFSDTLNLTKDDEKYLKHVCSCNLINGFEDGTFGPDKNTTRAEAATMIYRFTR